MSQCTFSSENSVSSFDPSFKYPLSTFSTHTCIDHLHMKRERKKQKVEAEEEGERKMEVVVVLEQVDALAAAATVAAAAAVEEEEELWGMRLNAGDVLADELMTWSTVWLPSCWDVEFVEKNYGVLFEYVVWDDDLWNLNTSTQLSPLNK
ncbi:uncharacterized protein LOC112084112 [Eutrema salsugineum]|uniref:uncharacterized protein LOC112084112 n=1 Tax=Eutrema salsugineum TaxID=72664 RepID=UPI000CED2FBA|nr:uncharacterized protein LOC112084112 [Eutrema salsugineum]